MPASHVIGLTGFAGAGKDAFAAAITGFQRVAFADPLRHVAADLWSALVPARPLTFDDCSDPVRKTAPIDPTGAHGVSLLGVPPYALTPRNVLQFVGTDVCRRHMGPDVWVAVVARQIAAAPDGTRIVVTDVRFPNEQEALANACAAAGAAFLCVKVVDPTAPAPDRATLHTSEAGVLDIVPDVLLLNDKRDGLDAYGKRVRSVVDTFLCASKN